MAALVRALDGVRGTEASTAGSAAAFAGNDPMAQALAAELSANLIDGSEVVLGMPIDDRGLKRVVRRVIILAAVIATFYICHFIANLLRGAYNTTNTDGTNSLWAAISSLLIELSIPACGYCGALYSNRQLTCCFCSSNLFITIVSITTFIHVNIRISEINGQCDLERNAQQRRTCQVWTSDAPEKYIITFIVIFLGCFAFWFGNSLYNRLSQEVSPLSPPIPIVGEVISSTDVNLRGAPRPSGDSIPETSQPEVPQESRPREEVQEV